MASLQQLLAGCTALTLLGLLHSWLLDVGLSAPPVPPPLLIARRAIVVRPDDADLSGMNFKSLGCRTILLPLPPIVLKGEGDSSELCCCCWWAMVWYVWLCLRLPHAPARAFKGKGRQWRYCAHAQSDAETSCSTYRDCFAQVKHKQLYNNVHVQIFHNNITNYIIIIARMFELIKKGNIKEINLTKLTSPLLILMTSAAYTPHPF